MRIAIGADHGGFDYKKEIIDFLEKNGYEYKDFGTYDTNSCDYPIYAKVVANSVASGEFDRGILVCGTGIGMSIAANKVKGIRCARVVSTDDSYAAKTHNHANAISLAADLEPTQALEIVNTFLHATPSIEDRHVRRVNKIISYENGEYNEV